MRNLKLEIEYDGRNYCGWQVQNSRKSQVASRVSIQEVIEKTLHKILQEKIRLIASGRTDAGVHAHAQIANFKTTSNITLNKLQKALNGLLPEDITITGIEEKDLRFHSRFSAKSKVYRYTILNRAYPSALLRNTVYFYRYPLDIRLIQQEAKCLYGRHDFKVFAASNSNVKNTIRKIKKISIRRTNYTLYATRYPLITIEIEADGFLHNMVRNIVGTLLEIGRGKLPKASLKKIILAQDRSLVGPTAPARGLLLVGVKY